MDISRDSTDHGGTADVARPGLGRRGRALKGAGLVAGGLLAGGVLAGGVLAANAETSGSSSSGSSSSAQEAAPDNGGRGPGGGPARGEIDESKSHHPGEELLTGDTADKVRAAALAEYPGATILRVETDSDGVYEAHLTTSAGERVTVEVDKDFAVTGTEQPPAAGEQPAPSQTG